MLALTACGGADKTPAEAAADCLDAQEFSIDVSYNTVFGSSPSGVAFTVTLDPDGPIIDDSGNAPTTPGGEPQRLLASERAAIRECATDR